MSTELTIKKGRGVPKSAEMAEAELALDLDDGTLYSKLGDGLVHALNEAPDADKYGHWKLQVDYGTPYEVESGRTANFEGTNGIKVTRTGDTVTIDGSELDLDEEADNYQYWTYRINGFNTTNVLSTQLLDFQSGDGIDIAREGYGIKISATGGGGGGGEFVHIGDTPPDSPEEGQQWMEVPASGEATMWIYDGAKWLQHPAGKDGAPGADGNIADATTNGVVATWDDTAKQWTPDGAMIVSGGDATFSGDVNAHRVRASNDLVLNKAGLNTLFYTDSFQVERNGTGPTLTIDATGNATFSGTVNAKYFMREDGSFGIWFGNSNIYPTEGNNAAGAGSKYSLGDTNYRFKDGYFSGNLYKNGSLSPLINAQELIETLSTLRNATKDETTLEGLRDAIGNAVGGLIEKFEAMQSTATQEISDE